jgi:PAT family beta-lactamase induction signal transducer AmpG
MGRLRGRALVLLTRVDPSRTVAGLAEPDPQQTQQRGPRHPVVWVSSTYFSEGFPYSLVNNVAELLFQALGASLQAIGLTALFHLPWNVKFLWAPLLDRYETKRQFLVGCEIAILALVLVLALLGNTPTLGTLTFVFLVLGVVSATHDVAIDGYYLEALDKIGQSKFVGLRAAAFRGATVTCSGPLLFLVDEAGWRIGWLSAAAVAAILLAYHATFLPRVEQRQPPLRTWLTPKRAKIIATIAVVVALIALVELRWPFLSAMGAAVRSIVEPIPWLGQLDLEGWIGLVLLTIIVGTLAFLGRVHRWLARHDSPYARAFVTLLDQPRMGRALAFIMLFRLGESFLMKMRMPFLRGPGGMDLGTFGLINGTLGWSAMLLATIAGGWLISRYGLRRWLWPFVLAQNVPNLLYAWAAGQPDPSALGHVVLGGIVIGEDIGAGLGTAVFMVYIMRCVDPRHKATHMAVLTAIMSLGFTLAGVASGFLADALGFSVYFVLTFVATVPSMVLMPFVPLLDDPAGTPTKPAPEA